MNTEQKRAIKSTILECREILEKDIEQVLINYGIYINKSWINVRDLNNLTEEQESIRVKVEKVIEKLEKGGFDKSKAVVEYIKEVAYTYLNRVAALRVMEVRGLIDEILVPRSEYGSRSFIGSRFYEVAREYCKFEMDGGLTYLLNVIFEEISEEIKMLFSTEDEYSFISPSNNALLKVIDLLCSSIEEESWQEDETIGWIYQYFNDKEKDDVFDRLYNKKQKIKVEDIPAATQLFTPDWIVKWIVESSLGKLWEEIKKGKREGKKVEEIKLLDPCCGSGHFLVKAYDLFYKMYLEEGVYSNEEIPFKILENNIHGIDIDLRAVQLTGLVLFIKTKFYLKQNNCEVNTKGKLIVNLVCADSILLNGSRLEALKEKNKDKKTILKMIDIIYEEFEDVRLKGSLIQPEKKLFPLFEEHKNRIAKNELRKSKRAKKKQAFGQSLFIEEDITTLSEYKSKRDFSKEEKELMESLNAIYTEAIKANDITRQLFATEAVKSVKLVDIFMKQYDVVVTNPPYMGNRNMNDTLSNFAKNQYEESNGDLYTMFIFRCHQFLKEGGLLGMITQQTFMFLSTYQKLRKYILDNNYIRSLVHLGPHAFDDIGGEKVNTVMFIFEKVHDAKNINLVGEFYKLNTFDKAELKKEEFDKINRLTDKSQSEYYFELDQSRFKEITGEPFVYWISEKFREKFKKSSFSTFADVPGSQNKTGDNPRFIRCFWETDVNCFNDRWFGYSKGGAFSKYYGNTQNVIDWSENARDFYKNNKTSNLLDEQYWFRKGICYTDFGGSDFNARLMPENYLFDMAGPAIFPPEDYLWYTLGFINSKLVNYCLNILNPTIHYQVSDLRRVPWIKPTEQIKKMIEKKSKEFYEITYNYASEDESQLNFSKVSLLKHSGTSIIERFKNYLYSYECDQYRICQLEDDIDDAIFKLYELEHQEKEDIIYDRGSLVTKEFYSQDTSKLDVSYFKQLYIKGIETEDKNGRKKYKKVSLKEISQYLKIDYKSIVEYRKNNSIIDNEMLISEVKNLISYYVGCIFGRYKINDIISTNEGIIPVGSSIYFEEDIIEQIYNSITDSFGEDNADEILEEIENILGKGLEEYFIKDFFEDHQRKFYVKPQKRPIYWHICSPRKVFNSFVYYHKLDNDTLYKIKSIYLSQMIDRYQEDIKYYTEQLIEARTNKDKNKEKDFKDKCSDLEARLEDLNILDKSIMEILPYEPNIDQGVIYNIIPLEPILSSRISNDKEREEYYKEVGK